MLWAKTLGGGNYSYSGGIGSDVNGNIYLAGAGLGRIGAFLAKYDVTGNAVWAENASDNTTLGLSTDTIGNSYITGYFFSTPATFQDDTLVSATVFNIFIAKYDSSGNLQWADSAGLGGNTEGRGIGVDANGNCYVTGWFTDSIIAFGNTTLTNVSGSNAFIAKLGNQATGIQTLFPPTYPITVFPNPSTAQFYFKGVSEGSTIEIYDVLGQQIYSSPVSGDNYTVNLSANAKGIYIYNIRTKTGVIQQGKLVVE